MTGVSPRRLRVLQVGKFYAPYRGGMETHLQALCGALRTAVDLSVVVANVGRRTTTERVDGVEVTRVGTFFTVAGGSVTPALATTIRAAGADIVHIHHPNPVAMLAYLASGHRGRLVVTYHSDIVRQRLLGRAFRPVLQRVLSRCDAIICTSHEYVASSPVLAAHRARCHVVPFSIPATPLARCDPAAVAAIRERHGPRIVLGVGRLVGYKGFEYLIAAMSRVRGRLLIVGDGPLRGRLQREVARRALTDRVVLIGEVEDVVPYYHAADVFALPSITRNEAFGIVQLEAMACGKPVVNTRLDSGVPSVSLHGVTGVTVPPADADALAAAINCLLDDPARRAEYGRAARRRVEQEFGVEGMGRRTLALYEQVMRQSSG